MRFRGANPEVKLGLERSTKGLGEVKKKYEMMRDVNAVSSMKEIKK